MLLQEFGVNVVKQKSIKGQAIPYLIFEFPKNGEAAFHEEFLDEYVNDLDHYRYVKQIEDCQQCDVYELSILDEYVCCVYDKPIS